jgi:integrase
MTSHLHIVTPHEAEIVGRRQRALRRFAARYPAYESRRTMERSLMRFVTTSSAGSVNRLELFPWELLSDELLTQEAWNKVLEMYSPATARKDASALRMMLWACWKEGLLTWEEYQDARGFSIRQARDTGLAGRYVEPTHVQLLLQHDEGAHHTRRVRDAALILTLLSTGARRQELEHVLVSDIDLAAGSMRLRVTKNGSPRTAFLHAHAAIALAAWLEVRGRQPGPAFTALSRSCRVLDRRLSAHQMWKIIRTRAAAAGVGTVTPHDLRRTFATDLLDAGVDLALVSRLMGHRSPDTTVRYDRRPDRRQHEAVQTLPLPAGLGARRAGVRPESA